MSPERDCYFVDGTAEEIDEEPIPAMREVKCFVMRDGDVWEVVIEMPIQDEGTVEWIGVAIAAIDYCVDIGMEAGE